MGPGPAPCKDIWFLLCVYMYICIHYTYMLYVNIYMLYVKVNNFTLIRNTCFTSIRAQLYAVEILWLAE